MDATTRVKRSLGTTARVLQRRRASRRQQRRVKVADPDSYDESYSLESSDSSAADQQLFYPEDTSLLASYVNKFLLLLPVAVTLFIRALPNSEFRSIVLAWSIILPFTSSITIDEGLFPALVASSLGCDNSVVARNLYLSIARSRLGLMALAILSVYLDNIHILLSGIMLNLLLSFSSSLLQNSIPKPELTLICCAVVNAVYYLVITLAGTEPLSLFDPAAVVACGLAGALPCYPLFVAFARKYRETRGTGAVTLNGLASIIYVVYFAAAGYLFFGVCHPHSILLLWDAIYENSDLLAYWGGLLAVASTAAYFLGTILQLDGRRKLWHVTTIAMFIPVSVRERPFTKMCLAVALVLFIALEIARAMALPPLGVPLHNVLKSFIDHRDKRGPVVISHIYLLLGISVPIFLGRSPAGIVCLGAGDTAASQVGRRFGRIRCFGHKSIEGCIAFSVAVYIAQRLFTTATYIWPVAIATALLEAVSPINDNLVVPVYMLSLQCLISGGDQLR